MRRGARAIADEASTEGLERARAIGKLAGQHAQQAARILSSSGKPAGACPAALPGVRMTMDDDVYVTVWQRLCICFATDMLSVLCQCSAGVAPGTDHAMVCKQVRR